MRRVVQICSLIALSLVLIVSAEAQISKTYDVRIPFDFNIGREAYQAGTYRVSLIDNRLLIRNQKTNTVKVLLASPDNSGERSEAPRFSFSQIEGKNMLVAVDGGNFNVKLETLPPSDEAYAGHAAPPAEKH
jgi:hypothetical protein